MRGGALFAWPVHDHMGPPSVVRVMFIFRTLQVADPQEPPADGMIFFKLRFVCRGPANS